MVAIEVSSVPVAWTRLRQRRVIVKLIRELLLAPAAEPASDVRWAGEREADKDRVTDREETEASAEQFPDPGEDLVEVDVNVHQAPRALLVLAT